MDRREFLKVAACTALTSLIPGLPGWAFNNGRGDASTRKLIVIMLRGAADGLNIVAPYGDSLYYQIRPSIAIARPGAQNGLIDLDGHFGMHPAMAPLLPLWQDRTLAFVHASGSPDPSRSHFDAQDYMESGIPGSRSAQSGWLNRLVQALPAKHTAVQAVSLGPVLPRILSGAATVATVSKAMKAQASAIDRPAVESVFSQMYAGGGGDLSRAYAEGLAAHKEINEALSAPSDTGAMDDPEQKAANRGAPTPRNYAQFGRQVAQLFRKEPSMQVAFLDFGGWDTHINEGSGTGQLANHLRPLAAGLAQLASGLGDLYKDTRIVVMSEFGRTAHENGNGGTDHGHGNVMWILGGGISGGKVYGRWSGLANNALYQGRDLPATTDFRAVLTELVADHMELPKQSLAAIFPDFQARTTAFVQG